MSFDQTLYLVSAVLFLATLIFSIIPVYLFECFAKKEMNNEISSLSSATKSRNFCWPSKDQILQFLTQLGGGILLHTSLVHMLPEIRVHYHQYLEAKANSEGHVEDEEKHEPQFLPDLLVCLGFFVMFAIEESMQALLSSHNHLNIKDADASDHDNLSLPEQGVNAQKVFLNPDPRPSLRSQITLQHMASRTSRPSIFSQLSYTACDIINITMEDSYCLFFCLNFCSNNYKFDFASSSKH